ncbi:MAG TPA: Hsp20/alpha crystallin family protein [Polyangia bacterium]|nr:Hsp20/alpha crystallin family protein [Polyangia bacterium]
MANIVRRGGESRDIAPSARGEWDPFRMMRDLLRWDPFSEMLPYAGAERLGFVPQFEVKETPDAYIFKADLPGVKEQDLEISVTGNRLSVSGKREQEERQENETFYAYERAYGSFTRSFTLPEGVDADHVQADLREGVLTLTVPKLPEMQPKKINIKGGAAQPQQTKGKA